MWIRRIFASRLVAAVACLLLIAAFSLWSSRDTVARQPAGPANVCQAIPEFVKPFNLTQPYFDTSRRDRSGLVLVDGSKTETAIQKPNWRQFGSLGPLANGADGVTYTAGVPVINTISTNEQNHLAVLRLDPKSGDLSAWARLQGEPLTTRNYYGITALAFDCTNRLLYAAAVAGSTREEQKGFIAAVDAVTGQQVFRYDRLDALGLGIYGGRDGRHLYIGLARSSEVVRLKLTAAGKPFGEPEPVLRFDELNRTRARKLDFQTRNLTIDTTEFYYNLVASTEFEQQRLIYRYDSAQDNFVLQSEAL